MRAFAPLAADHPLVTSATACPICGCTFLAGDITALIPTAPADAAEAVRMREGRAYIAMAAPVHYSCAEG